MAATLKEAGKLYLEEAMMTETFRFESDLSKRLRAEGEARGETRGETRGKADALLTVLAARGFEVSDTLRDKITAIQDPVLLNSLVERAVTCTSPEDLFA
jgi:hypothetical protein